MDAIGLIKQFEGLSLKPYLCSAGLATIGYGHVITENGKALKKLDGLQPITKEKAEDYLKTDIEKFRKQLDSLSLNLNHNQYEALVSFIFNIGFGQFKDSTLLYRIKNGADKKGIEEAFLMWVKSGGKVLNGLVKRRKAEAALFNL